MREKGASNVKFLLFFKKNLVRHIIFPNFEALVPAEPLYNA